LQKNDLSTRVILYAKDSQVVRNCLGKSLLSIINIIYHGVSKKRVLIVFASPTAHREAETAKAHRG